MNLKKSKITGALGVKIVVLSQGKEAGRVFLYVLKNGLHKRPFGLVEDLFVKPAFRGQGLGGLLVKSALAEARLRRCYKVIATSRNKRPELKKYYSKFGLKVWGVEYRKDYK